MSKNPFAALIERNRAAAAQQTTTSASAPSNAGEASNTSTSIPPDVESMIAQLIDDDDAPRPSSAATEAVIARAEPTTVEALPAQDGLEGHTRLFVLDDAGSGQMNRILSGVVGTVDAGGRFAIHPDYKQLSYLFTLADAGQLPVHDDQVDHSALVPVNIPAAAAPALLASMVATVSKRWSSLYESVMSGAAASTVGLGSAMLQQERDNTERAVATYLSQSGMTQWIVPVLYEASIFEEDPSGRPQTEQELMASAVAPHNIQVRSDLQPWQVQYSGAEQVVEQAAAGDAPGWAGHQGPLGLVLEGELTVYAPSAAVAAQVGKALVDLHARARNLSELPVKADAVLRIELEEPSSDEVDGDRYF
ncbi:MAG: hypothetical protein E6Q67_02930 [Roseateles sp.]|nr:MAG: hypothetical protein E6Q67_02930 [Roseateles sp.]